jgi:hypothetical protein
MTTVSKPLVMSTRGGNDGGRRKREFGVCFCLGGVSAPALCFPRSNWERRVRITLSLSRFSYCSTVSFLPSLPLLYNREDGSSALSCWWKHREYQKAISLFELITTEQGLVTPRTKRSEEKQLCDSTKTPCLGTFISPVTLYGWGIHLLFPDACPSHSI